MELWVIISICAAFFQTIRTALQKQMKISLSTNSISFARFFYGLPFAAVYLYALTHIYNMPVPDFDNRFVLYCTIAGVAQIVATSLLVYLFSFKNFVVSSTFVKTEAIQTAILGMVFFSEAISLWGFIAIVIGIYGIMLMSVMKNNLKFTSLLAGLRSKEALIGLLSGGCFSIATLFLREASLGLENENFILSAGTTLFTTLLIQTILMGAYLYIREKEQWPLILQNWNKAGLIGVFSVLGSGCWFTAFTLVSAAYVKTVGQVEIIFTILVSVFIFKEQIKKHEIIGMILIIISVLILVYS